MGCLDLFWVFIKINFLSAGVAQLVERNLAKVEVASSRLVSRSTDGAIAKWPCTGLQIRLRRFDSASRLQKNSRGSSSVGRAQPCQGWGREFETRLPLQIQKKGNTEQFPFFRMWSQNDGTGRRSGLKIRRP